MVPYSGEKLNQLLTTLEQWRVLLIDTKPGPDANM